MNCILRLLLTIYPQFSYSLSCRSLTADLFQFVVLGVLLACNSCTLPFENSAARAEEKRKQNACDNQCQVSFDLSDICVLKDERAKTFKSTRILNWQFLKISTFLYSKDIAYDVQSLLHYFITLQGSSSMPSKYVNIHFHWVPFQQICFLFSNLNGFISSSLLYILHVFNWLNFAALQRQHRRFPFPIQCLRFTPPISFRISLSLYPPCLNTVKCFGLNWSQ